MQPPSNRTPLSFCRWPGSLIGKSCVAGEALAPAVAVLLHQRTCIAGDDEGRAAQGPAALHESHQE
eukprot:5047686-Pyramimonas_sp.AAC.1